MQKPIPSLSPLEVEIDYSKPILQMAQEAGLHTPSNGICDFPDIFPHLLEGVVQTTIELYQFQQSISFKEALEAFRIEDLQPATAAELIGFHRVQPRVSEHCDVAGLGQMSEQEGHRILPFLRNQHKTLGEAGCDPMVLLLQISAVRVRPSRPTIAYCCTYSCQKCASGRTEKQFRRGARFATIKRREVR